MEDIKDIIQSIIDQPYAERLAQAKQLMQECIGILNRNNGNNTDLSNTVLATYLSSCIAADGEYSDKEKQMVIDIFGDDIIAARASVINQELYDSVDSLIDGMHVDDKVTFCTLAAYIFSADGTATKEEIAYFFKLLDD